jgi:hypothetical protein
MQQTQCVTMFSIVALCKLIIVQIRVMFNCLFQATWVKAVKLPTKPDEGDRILYKPLYYNGQSHR